MVTNRELLKSCNVYGNEWREIEKGAIVMVTIGEL